MDERGYQVLEEVIDGTTSRALLQCFEASNLKGAASTPGHRQAFRFPTVRRLAATVMRDKRIRSYASEDTVPVRAILFDKFPGANWPVAFHQDTTIAVKERVELPGFGAWSVKGEAVHVRPPASLLDTMWTARVDLDGSTTSNGALKVFAGSHRFGILDRDAIKDLMESNEPVTCAVPPGGALLMKPLIVHGSTRSSTDGHRRVVHIEFGPRDLPGTLEWHENAGLTERTP